MARNSILQFHFVFQYSCWEDKRKDEYVEVRVQVFGDKKVGKVKVLNLDEVEAAVSNKSLSGNGQSAPSATITSGATLCHRRVGLAVIEAGLGRIFSLVLAFFAVIFVWKL